MDHKLGKSIVRYIIVYVIAVVVLGIIAELLVRFAPSFKFGSGLIMVPLIVAAMDGGQNYFKTHALRPTNGHAWKLSVIFTTIAFALSAVSVVIALQTGYMDSAAWTAVMVEGKDIVAIAFAIFVVLGVLISRLMIGMGAKNLEKQARK